MITVNEIMPQKKIASMAAESSPHHFFAGKWYSLFAQGIERHYSLFLFFVARPA
jgi:hypothetical protein